MSRLVITIWTLLPRAAGTSPLVAFFDNDAGELRHTCGGVAGKINFITAQVLQHFTRLQCTSRVEALGRDDFIGDGKSKFPIMRFLEIAETPGLPAAIVASTCEEVVQSYACGDSEGCETPLPPAGVIASMKYLRKDQSNSPSEHWFEGSSDWAPSDFNKVVSHGDDVGEKAKLCDLAFVDDDGSNVAWLDGESGRSAKVDGHMPTAAAPSSRLWSELDAAWSQLVGGGQLLVDAALPGSSRRQVLTEWKRARGLGHLIELKDDNERPLGPVLINKKPWQDEAGALRRLLVEGWNKGHLPDEEAAPEWAVGNVFLWRHVWPWFSQDVGPQLIADMAESRQRNSRGGSKGVGAQPSKVRCMEWGDRYTNGNSGSLGQACEERVRFVYAPKPPPSSSGAAGEEGGEEGGGSSGGGRFVTASRVEEEDDDHGDGTTSAGAGASVVYAGDVEELGESVKRGLVPPLDIIVCTQVLEHLMHPSAALQSLATSLAPGGRIVLTVPFAEGNHGFPWDFHRYTWQAVARHVLEAGLCIQDVRAFGSTLETMLAFLNLAPLGTVLGDDDNDNGATTTASHEDGSRRRVHTGGDGGWPGKGGGQTSFSNNRDSPPKPYRGASWPSSAPDDGTDAMDEDASATGYDQLYLGSGVVACKAPCSACDDPAFKPPPLLRDPRSLGRTVGYTLHETG